jgi:hypothetical protein
MDIKDKLTEQDKQILGSLALECELLDNLLKERQTIMQNKAKEILAKNGLSPTLYGLTFNPSQGLWEANLKEGALIVPNRETRRAGRNN